MLNLVRKGWVALFALMAVAGEVFAQSSPSGPDMSSLTNNISWATVVTGILATGAAGVLVILTWKGVSFIYHTIKRA